MTAATPAIAAIHTRSFLERFNLRLRAACLTAQQSLYFLPDPQGQG